MSDEDYQALRAALDAEVAAVVDQLRTVVRAAVPEAAEEVDVRGRMVGYTFQPGTYKGLIAVIVAHRAHANLMFARGVELLDHPAGHLLEGTGKKARHIAFRDQAMVDQPEVHALLKAAARLQ